jgi:hypothetical protein
MGGVIGAALSGPSARHRQGRAVLVAGAVWWVAGFGLAHTLWLAVTLLVVCGGADAVGVVFGRR